MAGVKHMTVGERQKIIELAQTRVDGRSLSYTDVGRLVGRSRNSVRWVLERAQGVKPRARRLTVKETKRIIELYQTRNGNKWMSTVEVGKAVGRSAGTVHEVVTKAGIARTRSEAATVHLPEHLRQRIICLHLDHGWSSARIADVFKLKTTMVCKVLNEANVSAVVANEAELLVALYRQGRSAKDVAILTGRPVTRVSRFARQAGAMRPRKESARLAMRRIAASNKLAKLDLRPLAARWIDGAEVEELAAEQGVPPDLLWDALATALA